jgi:hypothetical protein
MTAKTWPQPFELFLEDGVTALAWHEGPLARAVRGETIANFDIVIKHRDNGKSISLVANGGPIQADSQKKQSGMIVYHDITAAKEAERQLRHAQKMEALGQLTGGTPVQTLPRNGFGAYGPAGARYSYRWQKARPKLRPESPHKDFYEVLR